MCVLFPSVLRFRTMPLYCNTETHDRTEGPVRDAASTHAIISCCPCWCVAACNWWTAGVWRQRRLRSHVSAAAAAAMRHPFLYVTSSNWSAVAESHPHLAASRQKRHRTNVSFPGGVSNLAPDRSRRAPLTVHSSGEMRWGWREERTELLQTTGRRQSRKP